MGSTARRWGPGASQSPRLSGSGASLCDTCRALFKKVADESRFGEVIRCKSIGEASESITCSFCRILVAGLLNGSSHTPIDKNATISVTLPANTRAPDARMVVELDCEESGRTLVCQVGSVGRPYSDFRLVKGRDVDLRLIKGWMDICSHYHTDYVQNSCLVENTAGDGVEYATLSYVWGDVPSMRLTRKTLPLLLEPNSIDRRRAFIPQTILDAIILTKKLDIRYLWVDALCLVSDDDNDLVCGINSMDVIYEYSTLNIVAASGFDAAAGLPGVRYGSRTPTQPQENIKGTTYVTHRNVLEHLRTSRYATRGWTFQEQRLSHRSIIFVNQQVYWLCKTTEWSEDLTRDQGSEGSWLPLHVPMHLDKWSRSSRPPANDDLWVRFQLDIAEYSTRRLTHESDALRAISAVMNYYSKRLNVTFFQGLCVELFDLSILFALNQTQSGNFTSQRRLGFPSYSWTGWRNTMDSAYGYYMVSMSHLDTDFIDSIDFLKNDTYIVWYKIDANGCQDYLGIPKDGSVDSAIPDRRVPNGLSSMVGLRPARSLATKAQDAARERGYPVLNFMAVVVEFMFLPDGFIVDGNQRRVGWASLPEGTDLDQPTLFSWTVLSIGTKETQGSVGEVLSGPRMRMPTTAVEILSGQPVYWAMAVVTENEVAERYALGLIFQNAQFSPVPAWKEIILA